MYYRETFTALRNTRSRNEKIAILKKAGVLTQEILKYAYDPFKHYYINKVPKYSADPNAADFTHFIWTSILDDLHTRRVSGHAAIDKFQYLLGRCHPEDAVLLTQIVKKDLRCGISAKTINKAIPGLIPEFGVTLAKKWDDSRWQPDLWMSLKLDGVRGVYRDGKLHSRNGHELIGLSHITDLLLNPWSMDGELIVPGEHFQDTSGLIRNDDPVPNAVFYVFDIPGGDLDFESRQCVLLEHCKMVKSPFIQFVKHVKVRSLGHLYETYDKALAAGYEGLVIKTPGHKYKLTRSWDWMKLKATNSEDLPVVDMFEGTGKYEDKLGGLIVKRKNGILVRVGSGFSDAERFNIWTDFESFKDQTIEVHYHEETPDGSLRHPVYKGFRWDK